MKKKYNKKKILKECYNLYSIKDFKRYLSRNINQKGGTDVGVNGSVGVLVNDIFDIPTRMGNFFTSVTELFEYVSDEVSFDSGTTYTSGAFSSLN
jgi:hypothetical protein